MHLHVTLDSGQIDPALRQIAEQRLERWLERFGDRLLGVRVTLRDEHGRHGAPRFRCRIEAERRDGGRLAIGAEHAHPQGALSGAWQVLRRQLAEAASGLPSRSRIHGRRQRGGRRRAA